MMTLFPERRIGKARVQKYNMIFADRIDVILEAINDHDLLDAVFTRFPSIGPWLKEFGIDYGSLRQLPQGDSGSHGVAYSDGTMVVKITDDDQEASASQRLVEHPVKGVNRIVAVGKLDKPFTWHAPGALEMDDFESQFFVIIQDLQGTELSELETNVISLVGDYIMKYYHGEGSPQHQRGEGMLARMNKYEPSEDAVKMLARHEVKLLEDHPYQGWFEAATGGSKDAKGIAIQLFEAVIRLWYAGIRFFDVQPGNTGKDNDGNYVLFDLGISTTKDRDRVNSAMTTLQAGLLRRIPIIG